MLPSGAAFPSTAHPQFQPKTHVLALKKGKTVPVPRAEVTADLPEADRMFSSLTNAAPGLSGIKGGRALMAGKMMAQAAPLAQAETPLVQALVEGGQGETYEELLGGHSGAIRTKAGGVVTALTADHAVITTPDGQTEHHELYNNFPLNRKSVTGDTVILFRRGDTVFRSAIGSYSWESGDLVSSYDPATKRSAWKRITGFLAFPCDKQLLRVSFRSGRSVCVTEDHSLVTVGHRGDLVPILPGDAKAGKTRCPLVFASAPDYTTTWSFDAGVLDGLYLADGHLPEQPGVISIAKKLKSSISEGRDLVRRLGGHPHAAEVNITWTDHALRNRLMADFGKYAHDKRISDNVLSRGTTYLQGLIAGYMSGDGCLWSDAQGTAQLAGVSVSRDLRDGLVVVLQLLGVGTTLFTAPRKKYNDAWRDAFGFRVMNRYLQALPTWFFYSERKGKWSKIAPKSASRSSEFEAIPLDDRDRTQVYRGFTGKVPHFVYKAFSDHGHIAKHRLAGIPCAYGQWARSEILWDIIEGIEEIPHQPYVYDLSVEDSETFALADGLMVHNTSLHNTAMVKVGDKLAPGQLVAKSNFTDDQGRMAIGRNLRVGMVVADGNFEDAITISQSAANKLAGIRQSTHKADPTASRMDKRAFISLFPGKYTKAQLDNLDDQGMIKSGVKVNPGDPMILGYSERDAGAGSAILGQAKAFKRDSTTTWEGHVQGSVTGAGLGEDRARVEGPWG